MADDGNQDADQQARDLAANAAKERAKRLADQLAIEHAEREYDAARQQAAGGVAFQPRRQGRPPYQGPPLAQPRIGDAIGDIAPRTATTAFRGGYCDSTHRCDAGDGSYRRIPRESFGQQLAHT